MKHSVDHIDLNSLIINATRYAIGRSSYVTYEMADIIKKYANDLTQPERSLIIRDINREIEYAEKEGKTLGMDMDHRIWKDTVAFLEKINKKKND